MHSWILLFYYCCLGVYPIIQLFWMSDLSDIIGVIYSKLACIPFQSWCMCSMTLATSNSSAGHWWLGVFTFHVEAIQSLYASFLSKKNLPFLCSLVVHWGAQMQGSMQRLNTATLIPLKHRQRCLEGMKVSRLASHSLLPQTLPGIPSVVAWRWEQPIDQVFCILIVILL